MRFRFTPAAERALAVAADWSKRAEYAEIAPETLLAGLLAEPECRAAVILVQHSIDVAAVRREWPALGDRKASDHAPQQKLSDFACFPPPQEQPLWQISLSPDVEASLQAASERLDFIPRPLELATEHLLLGLAAANHAVSLWLRRQGVEPDAIEAEIRRLHGYVLGGGDDISFPRSEHENQKEPDAAAIRILDASANRAREGLRVIEDYVRFALDDQHLTSLCKQLRHDLTEAMAAIPSDSRLAARETQSDVGTVLTTDAERRRGDLACVVRANFARLEESLRSLEEFGKIGDSCDMSPAIKQLRYRVYTLERAVETTRDGIERLASARLYVLIDGRASPEEFERLAGSLIDAGVHVIQLRDKRLGDRELLDRARRLRVLTRGTKTLFIVNDRPDLAVLAGADGVHVGQDEVSVKDARRIIGPDALVGVSTHTIEQARQAVLDGANYLGVGPTFPSETKRFERFPGVELLRAVATEIRLPAFAIGGLSRENLGEVLAASFTRVAVSGAISSADDPGQVARALLAMLGE